MNRVHIVIRSWGPWAVAAVAAVSLSMAVGPSGLGWPEIGSALWVARRERVWAGFIVGAALATSGTLMQALLRNPLADPYVLGVSGGGALGAALAVACGWSTAWSLPVSAFVGGLATLVIVYRLAGSRGHAPSIYALLLSGVIVGAMCGALLMMLITLVPSAGLRGITWWMLGHLQVASVDLLRIATGWVVAVWVIARGLAPQWNALTLGHDVAHHVGVRARETVALGLALATLAATTAVALAGLIGFVGLVVPHVGRSLVGSDHRRLLPAAALGGGTLLVLCDALARSLHAPAELPVGVITALLGGPFFLMLLRRRRGWVVV